MVRQQLYGSSEVSLFAFLGGMVMKMKETGAILKKLTAFSVPLILSGLLQQLFNWVDALIVGNVLGETALAAVGATSSVYGLFITLLVGFTSGLSVLFAQQYGEGNHAANARLLAFFAGVLAVVFAGVAALGIAFTGTLLEKMDTPEQLFSGAQAYLRIIFLGVPFLALYNTYSAALRGMGNSRVPFVAVLISSVTNGVLDVAFVAFFGFGISGAAAATVLAQIAMTAYVVIYTLLRYPRLRPASGKKERGAGIWSRGMKFGTPPAVQSSISSFGNLFLQKFMNGFGEQTVAAITTAYRVDSVLFLPLINFSTAIATLVAQETGAGNKEEARRILKFGSMLMLILSVILTAVIVVTGKSLLSMFGLTAESVQIGEDFFRAIAVYYFIFGLSMSFRGYLEGTGDLVYSGIMGILGLGVRLLCSYCFEGLWGNMVIAYAEVFSWVFLLGAFVWRYLRRHRD